MAKIMKEHQIRRLVVLDRADNRVVGIVSLGDLARNEKASFSGKVLQRVSERANIEAEAQEKQ